MNALLIAARGFHYASAMLLVGELVFVLAVARSWRRGALDDDPAALAAADARCDRYAVVWLAVTIVSGALWLALEASVMSGLPLAQALDRPTLGRVLLDTVFGRVWLARAALAVALGALLFALHRSERPSIRMRLIIALLVVAAAYLALLAAVGHAAVEAPDDAAAAIAVDVVHLLAGSAWLGALPAFVFMLARVQRAALAAPPTRRFSLLGAICVALLAATGLTSAWYLVGDVPALLGTAYGRLLGAKLALFALMLMLAIANRWYLSVRLSGDDRRALRALRRNAAVEFGAGLGVIAIVGALGITTPAAHESPLWPFTHTLGLRRIEQSAPLQMVVAAAATLGAFAAGALLAGVRSHSVKLSLAGAAGTTVAVALIVALLAEPAFPTTYAVSPVGYTVDAIARGRSLYTAHCTDCHGPGGHGEGGASRALPKPPPDLGDHAAQHREGELYWPIAHGVPGSPMPAFSPPLTETDVWLLVQFLYTLGEARDALAMSDRLRPLPPIVAPDFTFEVAEGPQQSLRQLRGSRVVLLVLCTLPQSSARLDDLAAQAAAYARLGARVIAVPIDPASVAAARAGATDARPLLARAGPDVAPVYLMFARRSNDDGSVPDHVEFLIDARGELRMRWVGIGDSTAKRNAETLEGIDILAREPPRAAPSWGHGHRSALPATTPPVAASDSSATPRTADSPVPASRR